jgi:hypothetical protein
MRPRRRESKRQTGGFPARPVDVCLPSRPEIGSFFAVKYVNVKMGSWYDVSAAPALFSLRNDVNPAKICQKGNPLTETPSHPSWPASLSRCTTDESQHSASQSMCWTLFESLNTFPTAAIDMSSIGGRSSCAASRSSFMESRTATACTSPEGTQQPDRLDRPARPIRRHTLLQRDARALQFECRGNSLTTDLARLPDLQNARDPRTRMERDDERDRQNRGAPLRTFLCAHRPDDRGAPEVLVPTRRLSCGSTGRRSVQSCLRERVFVMTLDAFAQTQCAALAAS